MPAARYWRIARIETFAGGDLELSEVALYEGATRVDGAATVSAVVAPVSGSLTDLGDASFSTSARWDGDAVRLPGFAVVWDFGAGVTKDVTSVGVAGPGQVAFAHKFALEYSSDGAAWETRYRTPVASKYPGTSAFFTLDAAMASDNWRGLAVGHAAGDFLTTYGFDGSALGAAPPVESKPTWRLNSVDISSDGAFLAASEADYSGGGKVLLYAISGNKLFRASAPDLSALSDAKNVAFSTDGVFLAVARNYTPYLSVFKKTGGTYTFLTNGSEQPAPYSEQVAFSADGAYLALAGGYSPYLTIYKRSGDTFTKLPNPASLPPGAGQGVAFSPDGLYLACAHSTSPYLTIYERSGDTFTKLPNPASPPSSIALDVAFDVDGTYLAVGTTGGLRVYKLSGGAFALLADLDAPGGAYRAAFSPDGNHLAVAEGTTPFVSVYERSGDTFTKLPNPATLPTSTGYTVAWTPFSVAGAGVLPANYDPTPLRSGAQAQPTLIGEDVIGSTQPVTASLPSPLDIYDGGRGRITGTVKEKNTPANTPLKRRVVLLSMPGSRVMRETWSDPVTGAYEFKEIAVDRTYTVLAYDHTGMYRGVVADNLTPELMP
jgi:WD40 repeat protein